MDTRVIPKVGGKSRMNILMINNYCVPEIGAASHLYYYIAKEFVQRGHNIFYLTGSPRYNMSKDEYKKNLKVGSNCWFEERDGIRIIRVKLPYVDRANFIRRGIEHFEIACKLYRYSRSFVTNEKIDATLVYSPPLTLYWTAKQIRKITGAPFVLNVQDLFPQASIDLGVLKNPLLIRFFRKIESDAYDSADLITVHSERNKELVKAFSKNEEKILVLENWIDENEIKPGSKINKFSTEHNLLDKFVVCFAGTLGVSQDIEIILNAAKQLEDHNDILFLIVGDGPSKESSQITAERMGLKNVLFLPMQPKEVYPNVLNASDVLLVTLEKDVKTPVVPSKILSSMSAAKPIVAAMNMDGDGPRLIQRANCGLCVEAGDYKNLARNIKILYENPELRNKLGLNGRKYVEENLSVRIAADKYESLFLELAKRRR